ARAPACPVAVLGAQHRRHQHHPEERGGADLGAGTDQVPLALRRRPPPRGPPRPPPPTATPPSAWPPPASSPRSFSSSWPPPAPCSSSRSCSSVRCSARPSP